MAGATTARARSAEVGTGVGGDEMAFATLTERHRRELHVHYYRMLVPFDEADDAVQETLLKLFPAFGLAATIDA